MKSLLLVAALSGPGDADPTCNCTRQCDAMWVEAASALERLSGMRLNMATNFRLETHYPRGVGLYGMAERRPIEDGMTEISAVFVPRPTTKQMEDLAASATKLFRSAVNGAGARVTCDTQTPGTPTQQQNDQGPKRPNPGFDYGLKPKQRNSVDND